MQKQMAKKGTELQTKSSEVKPWADDERARLAKVLCNVFDLQKQYGKTTAQLENVVAGFCWALQAYQVNVVIEGIKRYVLQKSDMPTPADIRQIIDPIVEPWKPDWSIYNRFKKLREEQGPYALSEEEIEYMKSCEAYSLGQRAQ